MTEQAGSSNKPVEEAGPPPWERTWNDVKDVASKAVDAVVGTAKKAVEGAKKPWEMSWGGSSQEAAKASPVPSKAPTEDRFETVFSKLIQAESRGKHTDASGKLTASGVGAEGITQLMPKTAADPGYGVEPVKDRSEKEFIRFGRDYLKAMLNEFDGDYEKALAAYNAGVGNVKKAITKGGTDWKDHLPKKSETLPYIKKILGK